MIAINSSPSSSESESKEKCKLVWVDNDDMIHEMQFEE